MDASIILRTARPKGLLCVLESLSAQVFSGEWELVLVDSGKLIREELVEAYWKEKSRGVPLKHVLPLHPPGRNYHCWDIPLFMNTGWVYAEGKVCLHLEDYMTCGPEWLQAHFDWTSVHPNLATIGDVFDAETGGGHFGRICCQETLDQMNKNAEFLKSVQDPARWSSANRSSYGYWLSGNLSLSLEAILKSGGAVQYPTHWPEAHSVHPLFDAGVTMYPLPDPRASAKHYHHPGGDILPFVFDKTPAQPLLAYPVDICSVSELKQVPGDVFDLAGERRRVGLC